MKNNLVAKIFFGMSVVMCFGGIAGSVIGVLVDNVYLFAGSAMAMIYSLLPLGGAGHFENKASAAQLAQAKQKKR